MATATTPKKSRTAAAKTIPPAPPVELKAAQRAADTLKMGGDATRVRLMLLLAVGERNVGQLVAAIGQSQPAVSHHVALLRHSGIVEYRREGKENRYTLTTKGRDLAATVRRLVDADAER
jgi:DNA-binding transcriptional ArsR family regulator